MQRKPKTITPLLVVQSAILFHECFHGDNGAGLGASHQTGRTGVAATLIMLFGSLDAQQLVAVGKTAAFTDRRAQG